MARRETLKQAKVEYVRFEPETRTHILRDIPSGKMERWFANKNHASYGLIYKNTHLEFAASVL